MAEVYVTLGEAAELERVKYNTMVKRVLRKQESFVTKTEKSENGGKDVVLVAVSSLSKQARNAWKEREKLKSFTEEFPDKKEDEQKPEVPWYVNTDVDWYIENYKERYYKAVELGNVVRKFLQYDEGDRTKYAEELAQKYLGKGQRMDGRVQDINNAGIVTGLYGRAKESQSIGEVKSFPISEAKLLKLLPEGIEDYIETLDKAKYVTIRQYIGKEDYYVTSANMMSPEGSDYSYAEDVRVSNRLVKAVRAKALDELQVEVDPGDIETSITNIQEQLNTPVEDAVRDKVISSGSVTIDTENLNILVDEKLDINITYVPMGHVREMNLTFAVENPYAAS